MAYIFSGIFSDQKVKEPIPRDSDNLIIRKIDHPEIKSGAFFPNQANEQIEKPNQETYNLINSLSKVGFSNGFWFYYSCWGGEIEYVAAAKIKNLVLDASSYIYGEDLAYKDLPKLLSVFNISIDPSGHFEPFEREFWLK